MTPKLMPNRHYALVMLLSTSLLLGCGSGGAFLDLVLPGAPLKTKVPSQIRVILVSAENPAKDVTSSSTFQMSADDGSIAKGLITCQRAGEVQVNAAFGPLNTSATLKCVGEAPGVESPAPPSTSTPAPPSTGTPAPTVTGLRIVSRAKTIRSETPYQLQAVADYSDRSSSDASAVVKWTANSNIAYISATGRVFCNAAGTVTVSATLASQVTTADFTCVLKRITPVAGFAEHVQQFDGPFASWVNVKTVFGAKGDGISDDTQALQNALNSLTAQPSVLWIPKGNYVITKTLRIRAQQEFSIIGEDPRQTVFEWHGSAGETMISFEGCTWFRLARLSWDGLNVAGVAIHIASTLRDGENYPTFDDIEDQKISRVGKGLQIGYAGETSIQRVNFDHNTMAGISLEDWNALNFNVVDSLFTDCNIGVTNYYGAGAFNVSNSVFVRSKTADMMMGNTGPFSERQNISFDSQAFFVAVGAAAGANITLQANTIVRPRDTPIQVSNPGPLTLLDNQFIGLDPSLNILKADGYYPLGFFSMGNEFAVPVPFAGHLGAMASVDEVAYPSDPAVAPSVPIDVYIPELSHRSIFEVPQGASSAAIQETINTAAAIPQGAVVHFPVGTYPIDQTLTISGSSNLSLAGDGTRSILYSTASLAGPVVQVTGPHVELENLEVTASKDTSANSALEIDIDDRPSTQVHCDQCKTIGAKTAIQSNGIDHALVDFRIGVLNAESYGASITGGTARSRGYETLGRFDAFMSGVDAYTVSGSGHFLVEDGWHDSGQGPKQFSLTGSSVVTHQGGAVLTQNSSGMIAEQFTGRVSLLGVSTDSRFGISSSSTARVAIAGNLQVTGDHIANITGQVSEISQQSNFNTVNNGVPTPFTDEAPSPTLTEQMFGQTRTEYVVPRVAPSIDATNIVLHRVVLGVAHVGLLLVSKDSTRTFGFYSISSPGTNSGGVNGSSSPNCSVGSISMAGKWSLQGDQDGFYGLQNGGSFLSSGPDASGDLTALGMSPTLSYAGQRWSMRPSGNGLFKIVSRANGEVLTRGFDGCVTLSPEGSNGNQEWAIDNVE